ncbi:hypothetical protein PC113_g5818 [Phytophthora cactorum]|uniref:Tc1-like transposase DDE domain-containing protein n=1 Tax=Phytophthora cactorum TaxID=29920 RepID=A0A8T0ZKL0_9STRA|nr:hypothetical protein PC113_g5818 [Phytophthora cactorum]
MRIILLLDCNVKQIRIEPATCNNDVNKEKRRVFAERLKAHQSEGNYIVYYDETNFNVYVKVQCAVSSAIGLVTYRLQRGGIRIDKSAVFVEEIYKVVKASSVFQNCFRNKKIVIVLDNAPAHHQTEERVTKHPDMELLHLGPYSPMCNSIEGCFNVLKAHIKNYLAVYRDDSCGR